MAAVWTIFWVLTRYFFEDVYDEPTKTAAVESSMEMQTLENPGSLSATPADSKKSLVTAQVTNVENASPPPEPFKMSAPQWGVTVTMCWFAMTCFFILGAWESNLPVFTDSDSPFNPFHFSFIGIDTSRGGSFADGTSWYGGLAWGGRLLDVYAEAAEITEEIALLADEVVILERNSHGITYCLCSGSRCLDACLQAFSGVVKGKNKLNLQSIP